MLRHAAGDTAVRAAATPRVSSAWWMNHSTNILRAARTHATNHVRIVPPLLLPGGTACGFATEAVPSMSLDHVDRFIPPMKKYPIPRDQIVSILQIITACLQRIAATTELAEVDALYTECETQVLEVLEKAHRTAGDLRKLAAAILQMTRDPSRFSIVARLYAMAFRRGDDDAGYSWATMVMEGMVPAANKELEVAQAEKATQTYSQLARKGHAQAQFGMGRLVLAKILSQKEPSSEPQHKQVQMAVDLWQRAGRNGYADAWFELGQLFHQGQLVPRDKSRALTYFEHGARGGSAMACHALGTLYLARAKKFVEQSAQAEASKNSALAARYFLQAAQKGHAASAYNVGLLYLLPPGADNNKETKEQHKIRHGVQPDDQNAREWFSAAASKNFLPAMMNYGAMLMEGRGMSESDTRVGDLEEARRVYQRAVQLCRQTQARASSPTAALQATQRDTCVAQNMMAKAEEALTLIDHQLQDSASLSAAASTSRSCTIM